MPGNIEFKGKIDDIEGAKKMATAIASEHFELEQYDVFFGAARQVRLKLRKELDLKTGKRKACLIAYRREDISGPKFSQYELTPVEDPVSLEKALKMSNGVLGKVEKKRDVYIVRRKGLTARVHIDVVKGLRDYLEFEVLVPDGAEMLELQGFAEYLMKYFGVSREEDGLPGAYFDLIPKGPEGDQEIEWDRRERKRKRTCNCVDDEEANPMNTSYDDPDGDGVQKKTDTKEKADDIEHDHINRRLTSHNLDDQEKKVEGQEKTNDHK